MPCELHKMWPSVFYEGIEVEICDFTDPTRWILQLGIDKMYQFLQFIFAVLVFGLYTYTDLLIQYY